MKKGHLLLTLAIASSFAFSSTQSAYAVPREQRNQEWGNANIASRADLAARALQSNNYQAAMSNYRALIGLNPDEPDFYLGLYSAASKGDNWKQAAMAFDELFDRCPEYKQKLAAQYADALNKASREDEAQDALKLAKKGGGDPNLIETRVAALIDKSVFDEPKAELPKKYVPPPRNVVNPNDVHTETSKFGLTLDNAFWSEAIVIAIYTGYEKEKGNDITFFRPPKAIYHIEKRLKGPPLGSTLPIRYEFHDKTGASRPDNWKFDESMMPKKGSKWIIFIPNCVPIDGMMDTYHGSFGRLEATDDNLDKILRVIELHRGQTR